LIGGWRSVNQAERAALGAAGWIGAAGVGMEADPDAVGHLADLLVVHVRGVAVAGGEIPGLLIGGAAGIDDALIDARVSGGPAALIVVPVKRRLVFAGLAGDGMRTVVRPVSHAVAEANAVGDRLLAGGGGF